MVTPALNIIALVSDGAITPPRTLSSVLHTTAHRLLYQPRRQLECAVRASDTTCRSTHANPTLLAGLPLQPSYLALAYVLGSFAQFQTDGFATVCASADSVQLQRGRGWP